jgi:hypothetical protein
MTDYPHEPNRGENAFDRATSCWPVYAPFGTDPVLSSFPDGTTQELMSHPLVANLQKVAATGVHVVALVDLFDDDTWLLQIPAYEPQNVQVTSRGKQQMDAQSTLTDFLKTAHRLAPEASVVLAMEGHGAGFLPDLDKRLFTLPNFTDHGSVQWRWAAGRARSPRSAPRSRTTSRSCPPVASAADRRPDLPDEPPRPVHVGAGAAFKEAEAGGVAKFPVIHLNNCFNMSVEVLHTIAPYAQFATGYCNYNFFTAGQAYPLVFEQLAATGETSSEQLAKWFAAANHAVLLAAGHEPTVAGTVDLARMHDIAEKVDDLSDALLATLRTASPEERPAFVAKIRSAIETAQQYDTRPDFILETPDELTDLDSFAAALLELDFLPYKVAPAAEALRVALEGIKQYGDTDSPWMDPNVVWDFSSPNLAMNIFLPDPLLNGLWDWRSLYYLDVNPDPNKPQVQPNISRVREGDGLGRLPDRVPPRHDVPGPAGAVDPGRPAGDQALRPAPPPRRLVRGRPGRQEHLPPARVTGFRCP